MSFRKRIGQVRQAEEALEAHERRATADWRQLRRTWHASWTPARILVAGLASGFLVGRRDTSGRDGGPGIMRMLSMLSSLMATSSARYAAHEADDAADSAGEVADAVAPHAGGAVS